MTDPTTNTSPAPSVRPPAPSRRALDKLLPEHIVEALGQRASQTAEITPQVVRELHGRFDLEASHGVSRKRLSSYMKRLRQEKTPQTAGPSLEDSQPPAGSQPGESKEQWSSRLRAHRRRQASVASILDATFGRLGECNADLWGHRAYLMLIGLVYERLAIGEDEIPTDELVALAKIIAENRRVEIRLRQIDDQGKTDEPNARQGDSLPPNFGDVVRQVYGTNFHAPNSSPPDEDDCLQRKDGGVGG